MTNTIEAKVGILVQGADDVMPIIVYGLEAKPVDVLMAFCDPTDRRVVRMSAKDFIMAFAKASGVSVTINRQSSPATASDSQ